MGAGGAKSASASAWRRNRRRVEILDSQGRSRASRDTESVNLPELIHADLDGDSRDELLFRNAGRLCAVRGDLTDIWSWPTREPIREVLPASPRRAATVILNPSLGLDGATGRPAWSIDIARSFLSSNDGKSSPHVLTAPDGATVCRMAMPVTAEWTYLPAQGLAARPAASRDDPRSERPLPWVSPVEPYANPLVQVTVAATLINVCIPVAIIWLATRRRFWSMRLLLALPVVAAILLTSYSTLSSLILDRPQMTDASLVGRIPECRPVCAGRCADRGLRDRVRFIPGPRAVVEVAAGPPGRGRHSCCGVFGPESC